MLLVTGGAGFIGSNVVAALNDAGRTDIVVNDMVGADSFIGVFRYGGMPVDDAEANMRLFASDVMPALKDLAPVEERLDLSAAR